MIGNLFNAISIALFSSVLALGGVKADEKLAKPLSSGSSWVTGQECDVFYSGSTSYSLSRSVNLGLTQYLCYDYDSNVLDDDSFTAQSYIEFLDELNNNLVVNTQDYVCFSWSKQNEISYNGNAYYLGLRVSVPLGSGITGFEFKTNTDVLVFKYESSFNGIYIPSSYLQHGTSFNTSIGLYSNLNFDYKAGSSVVSGSVTGSDSYFPYVLSEFIILFGANAHGITITQASIDFQFIKGGSDEYMSGYNDGYSTGYQNGLGVGWTNGYAEGLATASQSSFSGLFNAIADTPLRFLYGLFNFDLFGMSVLAIVLSLLTGIIVFGIIKKFWK